MTTINNILTYKNGDYQVTLYSDGTKIRNWSVTDPTIDYPESIDLKITNRCDQGCEFCHENSSLTGKHASIYAICDLMTNLPRGVEIAIGGGNPLCHPDFCEIVLSLQSKGLIVNVTSRVEHALYCAKTISLLRHYNAIKGLGISSGANNIDTVEQLKPSLIDNNTVFHCVVGIDNPCDLALMNSSRFYKILILGYKQIGRGKTFYNQVVKQNIKAWRYWIRPILQKNNLLIGFDNLALSQLGIKSILPQEAWEKHYMGDDGKFTMYVDAVEMEYAISSCSEQRFTLSNLSVVEAFQKIRNL